MTRTLRHVRSRSPQRLWLQARRPSRTRPPPRSLDDRQCGPRPHLCDHLGMLAVAGLCVVAALSARVVLRMKEARAKALHRARSTRT